MNDVVTTPFAADESVTGEAEGGGVACLILSFQAEQPLLPARRQILGEVVRAWVDEIPESELESHYAKALADLDEHDLSMLAAWHASLEVGHPLPNKEFLVNVFSSLGENRREALKIAAGFRGEEAFQAGVSEEQALDTVLPRLSPERAAELASECVQLYIWDRLGCEN